MNGEYARAKQILSEHKEGHNRLAQLLIQREVIMAEDVEEIFGKRPWVSRTQELMDLEDKSQLQLENMPESVKQAQAEHEAAKKNNDSEADDNNDMTGDVDANQANNRAEE